MTAATRILLLEDDPNLGLIVQESLQGRGYEVTLCRDGQAGLEACAGADFALFLVDVMMPRLDGFGFAREARRRLSDAPLIFLTARSLTEDRIEGFRLGCDDYVTKPFSMEELVLRIEAVLRRAGTGQGGGVEGRRALGKFVFDPEARILAAGARERRLTDRESELLDLLSRRPGSLLERSFALQRIWGSDGYNCSRSMDVFISRLRKYLAEDSGIEIRVVHGRGFRLLVHRD